MYVYIDEYEFESIFALQINVSLTVLWQVKQLKKMNRKFTKHHE